MPSPISIPTLRSPGLFVTGTDTGVGKTVVTCAIASALRRQLAPPARVGVCKPFATGCRREREGLVSEDAELLAYFADCRQPLDVINPIRFALPVAPAVAAEQGGAGIEWDALHRSLDALDATSEALLIEGVGGLMVPLDPAHPKLTVLDLAKALGFPVLVVARSVLGTLSHTAMTVGLLRNAGCKVAGIVMNGYDADVAKQEDPSVATNRVWLEKLTGAKVLAVTPRVSGASGGIRPPKLPDDLLAAVDYVYWPDVMRERVRG